ncbi:hypothetical protein DFH09DRAFT_1165006, partial [Mycena vulgaris]
DTDFFSLFHRIHHTPLCFVVKEPSDPHKFTFGDDLTFQRRRISDGKLIMLKCISKSTHPFEVEIATSLAPPPLADDPRNHAIPISEVLQNPVNTDKQILVMPRLIILS